MKINFKIVSGGQCQLICPQKTPPNVVQVIEQYHTVCQIGAQGIAARLTFINVLTYLNISIYICKYILYLRGIGGQYAFLYTVEYRQGCNENGN